MKRYSMYRGVDRTFMRESEEGVWVHYHVAKEKIDELNKIIAQLRRDLNRGAR
jgi:hypothetical protein